MQQQVQISFVYSPTSQMTDQHITERAKAMDGVSNAEMICRRLQENLKKLDSMQTVSTNRKLPSFKELKNNLLKISNQTTVSSTSIQHNSQQNTNSNIAINHNRQIHTFAQQNNGKSQKMHTLNSFLTEIGEFKKSISQIRQKIIAPKSNNNSQSSITAHKSRGTPAKNYDKYSYTSYKDLSANKTEIHHSYDRWKSHEKLHSLHPRPVRIQQFTIDASSPSQTPTK